MSIQRHDLDFADRGYGGRSEEKELVEWRDGEWVKYSDHAAALAAQDAQIARMAEGREARQALVTNWVRETFGAKLMCLHERTSRLAEEAIELAQAEGLPKERLLALVEHVYAKPPGVPAQEVGGIGVTLLAYCGTAGISAEREEERETARVTALPRDHFVKRQHAKAVAGVAGFVEEP